MVWGLGFKVRTTGGGFLSTYSWRHDRRKSLDANRRDAIPATMRSGARVASASTAVAHFAAAVSDASCVAASVSTYSCLGFRV